MFVDLGNQVRMIWRLVSADSKAKSFLPDKLIVTVGVVKITAGSGKAVKKINLFTVSNG